MYGEVTDLARLEWAWARQQLIDAPTYWVVAAGDGMPHPRPVWGVWREDDSLALSVGTPTTRRRVDRDGRVAVHLDSGVDVVIVEGTVTGEDSDGHGPAIAAYDIKYDWVYDVDAYGPLTIVEPEVVVAWRSRGRAGRDGFGAAGRWRFG